MFMGEVGSSQVQPLLRPAQPMFFMFWLQKARGSLFLLAGAANSSINMESGLMTWRNRRFSGML